MPKHTQNGSKEEKAQNKGDGFLKKITALFLTALMLILSLCACKSNDVPTQEETTVTETTTAADLSQMDYAAVLSLNAGGKFKIYADRYAMVKELTAENDKAENIIENITYKGLPVELVVKTVTQALLDGNILKKGQIIELVLSVKKDSDFSTDSIILSVQNTLQSMPEVTDNEITVKIKTKALKEIKIEQTTEDDSEKPCPACNGTGKWQCETCNNTGFLDCKKCEGGYKNETCTLCKGNGKCTVCGGDNSYDNYCDFCDNSGECHRCLGKGKEPCLNCNNPDSAYFERRNGKIVCTDCDGHCGEVCQKCIGTGIEVKKQSILDYLS